MSLPKAFFLDTNVLDSLRFNFESQVLTTFVAASKVKGLTLLLPDATLKEINRHIGERVVEGARAFKNLLKEAPFLRTCLNRHTVVRVDRANLQIQAQREWSDFLRNFKVEKLGYEGVDPREIMSWYDTKTAPFGDGQKRKEFPDAFAVAALVHFAQTHGIAVAVISADKDFEKACERFNELVYFPTLPKLTEMLLLDDSAMAGIREAVLKDSVLIDDAIEKALAEAVVIHESEEFMIDDHKVEEMFSPDISVVAVGSDSCTVNFQVEVSFLLEFAWDSCNEDGLCRESMWNRSTEVCTGTAKLKLKEDRSGIASVGLVEFDGGEIVTKKVFSYRDDPYGCDRE